MERGGEEEEEEEVVVVGGRGGGQRVKGYESEQKKQNKKNKHKHIKCMQLPGTWLYGTRDNNNHKKTD